LLHQLSSWTLRNFFDRVVPTGLLLGAEVWRRKHLLHAEDLHALLRGVFNHRQMFLNILFLDFIDRRIRGRRIPALNQSTLNCSWHIKLRPRLIAVGSHLLMPAGPISLV